MTESEIVWLLGLGFVAWSCALGACRRAFPYSARISWASARPLGVTGWPLLLKFC